MKISKKASKKKIQKKNKNKKTQNKKVQRSPSKANADSKSAQHIELEFLAGLKDSVKDELNRNFKTIRISSETDTSLSFNYVGNISRLKSLRTVIAVYIVKHFAVPRPKALLGHEHWNNLLVFLKEIKQYDSFESFRLGAAGQDSPVFQRLKEDLAQALRLKHDDEGDFLLRFRPTPVTSPPIAEKRQKALKEGGWQVLVRISRRPLSARAWRQCNLAGGLNATVAASIVSIANIQSQNRVYCPMCGSGTLAIETHDIRRFESFIKANDLWTYTQKLQVYHGGHNPKLYVLYM